MPHWDWRFLILGAALGWLLGVWRSRHARRERRALRDAIRTVHAAGPILQHEIDRLEREIAAERTRTGNGAP